MLDSSSADFSKQAGIPALLLGGRRYLKLLFSRNNFWQFTLAALVQGSGPLFFIGSPDAGSVINDAFSFLAVEVGTITTVSGANGGLSFETPSMATGLHRLAISVYQPDGAMTASIGVFVDGVRAGPDQSLDMKSGAGAPMRFYGQDPLVVGARPRNPGQDDPSTPDAFFDGAYFDFCVWNTAFNDLLAMQDATRRAIGRMTLFYALTLRGEDLNVEGSTAYDSGDGVNVPWISAPQADPSFGFIQSFAAWPTADRTVEMWVRGGSSNDTLLAYGQVASSSSGDNSSSPWWIRGTGLPKDDNWHHLAVVTDSVAQTETYFIDGAKLTGGTGTPLATTAGQTLLLGAQWQTDANDSVFQGQIRDVRIWSRVRSADELADAAASRLPRRWKQLVAEWLLHPSEPGVDTSGNDITLGFTFTRASPGAPFTATEAGVMQEDVAIGTAGADLLISRRDSLFVGYYDDPGIGTAGHNVNSTGPVQVFAKQATLSNHLPSQNVTLVTDQSTGLDAATRFRRYFYSTLLERSDELAASLYDAAADATSSLPSN